MNIIILFFIVHRAFCALAQDISTKGTDCVTRDGPSPGAPCVFPFTFGDKTYKECITLSDPEGLPWCSTQVDESGIHVGGGGYWGHCSSHCPGSGPAVSDVVDVDDEERLLEVDLELEKEKSESEVSCLLSSGLTGHCRTVTRCVGVSDQDIDDSGKCPQGKDLDGSTLFLACCPDLLDNKAAVTAVTLASSETKIEDAPAPDTVSLDDVRSAFGSESDEVVSDDAEVVVSGEQDPEDDDASDNPELFHLRFNKASSFAKDVNTAAEDLIRATQAIQEEKNLTAAEAGIGLRFFNADVQVIDKRCPWTPRPTCSERELKFRTADGRCNNLEETNYGRAGTPLQRILDPSYGDQQINSPRVSVRTLDNGLAFDLPSARLVSTTMTAEENRLSSEHTVLVMQMGQFIDHDITHTPMHSVSCCNPDGSFPASFDTKKCFPIPLPVDDPFWKGRKTCMSFARSLAAPTLKCSLEFQQQMNQITHWLDASNIYGSSESESVDLRELFGGQLKMTRTTGTRLGLLPSCSRSPGLAMCFGCSKCFFAGDGRANEHLNLLSMHTLWVREHNRIARFLAKLNPKWNDDRLYQETRRIVTAEYQHIIFSEWLPIIIGSKFMTSFGLWPLSKGYSKDYLTNFDPRVTNEFATAAFRFGHSLIPTQFNKINPKKIRQGKSAAITGSAKLRDIFFKPQVISSSPVIVDELVAGLVTQEGNLWDNSFVKDVQNHLFEGSPGSGGLDLVALNIQRGRDHGLKGYNAYREVCSLGLASQWSDFEDLISQENVNTLTTLYADVNDVDLFVGGFLERKDDDGILGPTFRCIVGDTFARLKLGDRFFYDLDHDDLGPNFTEDQLNQIRKTSMARIICDNTDSLDAIQPQAFKIIGSSNANSLQFCNASPNIPSPNLGAFKEVPSQSRR